MPESSEPAALMTSWVNIFVCRAKFITHKSPRKTLIRSLKHYFAESCVPQRQGTAALTISLKKEEMYLYIKSRTIKLQDGGAQWKQTDRDSRSGFGLTHSSQFLWRRSAC